VLEQISSL